MITRKHQNHKNNKNISKIFSLHNKLNPSRLIFLNKNKNKNNRDTISIRNDIL
jgi:hypothetical protein